MNFVEKILEAFGNLMDFLGSILLGLVDFLARPLSYLLELLIGIFYFIAQLIHVVFEILELFWSLFEFFWINATALLTSVSSWVGFAPKTDYHLPSVSRLGFETALEQIGGTGLLLLVPNVLSGIMWIYFAIKVFILMGNRGDVKK